MSTKTPAKTKTTTKPRSTAKAKSAAPASDRITHGAYAVVGAADRVLEEARSLLARREQLPEELGEQAEESLDRLRQSLDDVYEQLSSRVRSELDRAETTVDDLASRGERVIKRIRNDQDLSDASKSADQARQGWKGAVTTLKNSAGDVASRVKAATTLTKDAAEAGFDAAKDMPKKTATALDQVALNDMTKAELYDMATARDIDGRSTMSKEKLVKALSA